MIVVSLAASGFGLAQTPTQTRPPFVPEFKLLCNPTHTVKEVPLEDPSADPFGEGPWYVNDDRSIWAGWQPMVPGDSGNRIMWIKPTALELKITGHRLDGEAAPFKVLRNDSYLGNGFEPNRLIFPEPGCWEVTATAGVRNWSSASRAHRQEANPGDDALASFFRRWSRWGREPDETPPGRLRDPSASGARRGVGLRPEGQEQASMLPKWSTWRVQP